MIKQSAAKETMMLAGISWVRFEVGLRCVALKLYCTVIIIITSLVFFVIDRWKVVEKDPDLLC